MSWFTTARHAVEPAPARGHRSLALRGLLHGLHPESRPEVLDLGPPLSGNIKFLSALGCRVRVADLVSSLVAEPLESRRPEAMAALAERLLPLEPDSRFAAVLAWDAFDYLRADQVAAVMSRLIPRLRREALVLVLVSMRSQIPATPTRYQIRDRENLDPERVAAHERTRPAPRYRQSDLVRMMPGLSVRRCYLLRSGIQEYLLGHA